MDEVVRVEIKPLPVWRLRVVALAFTGLLAGPAWAWEWLESWAFAGFLAVTVLLFLLVLFDFRRYCVLAFGPHWNRPQPRQKPSTLRTEVGTLALSLVMIAATFLPPLVFTGLALGIGVLVAGQIRRVYDNVRTDVAAGRF